MDAQTNMYAYIDPVSSCMLGQPIPKQTYITYHNQQQGSFSDKFNNTMKHFIGDSVGKISTCCNSNSKDSNDKILPTTFGSSMIKKIYGADGSMKEYQICSCNVSDANCLKNCDGFSLPTNYEFCKMTTTSPNAIYDDPKNKYIRHMDTQYFSPDCNTLKSCTK